MSVSEPRKILTPWATSGLKNSIPQSANPVTGKAGYDQGFPAINMTAKEAGGIPPFGQDFNGILFAITEILRYMQAGGIPTYSDELSSAIAGYSKGAVLLGSNGSTLYQSTINGNTSNPNSGGAGWVDLILKILPKRSFSPTDFIRIPDTPGGLIIQWGTVTSSGGTGTINLPTPYPNAHLVSVLTDQAGAFQSCDVWGVGPLTLTGAPAFSATNAGAATSTAAHYISIGY